MTTPADRVKERTARTECTNCLRTDSITDEMTEPDAMRRCGVIATNLYDDCEQQDECDFVGVIPPLEFPIPPDEYREDEEE